MKKIKVAIIMIVTFTLVMSPVCTSNAGWIDDWVSQKVYSGPNYYRDSKGDIFRAWIVFCKMAGKKRIIY